MVAKKKKTPKPRSRTGSKKKASHSGYFRKAIILLLIVASAVGGWLYLQPLQSINWPHWAFLKKPVGRAIATTAELQIALARQGFSSGSIDGIPGEQTRIALRAYQLAHALPQSGQLDKATAEQLRITDPVFAQIELRAEDFQKIAPAPSSWRAKGQVTAMAYNSMLEMVAEHSQSDPDYILQLNPDLNWQQVRPGSRILTPLLPDFHIPLPVAYLRIQLSQRTLQAYNNKDQLVFHCPVSIARRVEKRPQGELRVKVRVESPNYTFNPEILTAAAEREGISEKFIIQPGPNNPVGSVWIGLNLPSYGIHGTPVPEKVGRTESSGCFRLANWNAEILLPATTVGLPVRVLP